MKEKMSLEEATMKALLGQLDTPEEQKDDVEGIIDGVLVVTDPEVTPDEYTEVIDNAQEILEDTPEGEVPFNDQYVGEYLLTCPICGSSFINKDVLNVGDSCPICTQIPEQGFILNGQVATQEDVELQNDIKSEEQREENDDVNIGFEEVPEEEPVSEEDVEETEEELLASEEVRSSDKKLEESSEYKSKFDELDDLLSLHATFDNDKMGLYNYFNFNNQMNKEFNEDTYYNWLDDMKENHFDELYQYLLELDKDLDTEIDMLNESNNNYVKRMTTNNLKESKKLEESNKYKELRDKHQEEFNKFPIGFAFSDKQFKEAMEKLGLTENDTDKIVPIGASGFIRKSDVDAFNEMNTRHRKEEKEAMDADTTGEGYIKDMFEYELANHEYGYTYELDDTLMDLDLTMNDINNDERLKHGLDLALKRYKDSDELDESKTYMKRPEQLNENKEMKVESDNIIKEIKDKLYWLSTHNKNYNKEQYYTILDIQDLVDKLDDNYTDKKFTEINECTDLSVKTESNKYISAEEKLEAIYDDYKRQGMLDAYWTDLLNLIDDFDALDRWFDASYPDEDDLDEDWNKLEEN